MYRQLIDPGYVAFNGHVFTEAEAYRYNFIQKRINKWMEAEREVPEVLLNDSCKTFKRIIGVE